MQVLNSEKDTVKNKLTGCREQRGLGKNHPVSTEFLDLELLGKNVTFLKGLVP